MAKINITIDDELLKRVDDYSDSNFSTRSGLISQSVKQFLDTQDVMEAVKRISYSMQIIAEKNVIDEDSQKELEHFKVLAEMLFSK